MFRSPNPLQMVGYSSNNRESHAQDLYRAVSSSKRELHDFCSALPRVSLSHPKNHDIIFPRYLTSPSCLSRRFRVCRHRPLRSLRPELRLKASVLCRTLPQPPYLNPSSKSRPTSHLEEITRPRPSSDLQLLDTKVKDR